MENGSAKKKYVIPALTILTFLCCVIMAIVETVIEPSYWIKSAVKIVVFAGVPLVVLAAFKIKLPSGAFSLSRKNILAMLGLGAVIYGLIMGAYAITARIFDYSALVESMTSDQQVNGRDFIFVAAYISFGNSFLEEFLFRLVSFMTLSEQSSKRGKTAAYIFSSVMFAVYHVAMIGASFPPQLLILALVGLAAGGFIFDFIDSKSGKIYPSWVVHMFADIAIMTIWFLNI